MDQKQQQEKSLPMYGGPGKTSFFASQYDQRFSYCLYVPKGYQVDDEQTYPLLTIVHGSLRNAEGYRDRLADFAEQQQCIVLCPLFPNGIIERNEPNNYKEIEYQGIRYDLVLLAMVDEVAETYRVDAERFMLYGFSGGGQFSHRFYYLHPERLLAVSIGAPGAVTLLDDSQSWWPGTSDVEERFGLAINLNAMRKVDVQLVVGGEDRESMEPYDRSRKIQAFDHGGSTRVERIQSLQKNLEDHGIATQLDIVPGVAHENYKMLPVVQEFFAQVISRAK